MVQPASGDELPDEVDANNILSSLLDRLEYVLADVRASSAAKPLFVVEAELSLKLIARSLGSASWMTISAAGQPKYQASGRSARLEGRPV